jgi:drug/metabolite transporter (DMT)-like permease
MNRSLSGPTAGSAGTGYGLALAGAVAFSGKAIVAKLLYRHGIDALDAVALRMLLAWPFFILMAWWAGRGKPRPAPGDRVRILVLGFAGYYLASVLDFAGLQYISASLERLILFAYPTIVLLIVALRSKRPVTRRQGLALAVSYAGVLLAFGQEAIASLGAPGASVAWGSALVLASAVSYAVYLVLSGETVGRYGALRLTGLSSSFACALCVAQFCALRPLHAWAEFGPAVWELSVLNATLCTVLPIWMVMRAMELIGSSQAAQVGMVGPISTVLLAVWLLGEPFTFAQAAATVIVLLGVSLLRAPGDTASGAPAVAAAVAVASVDAAAVDATAAGGSSARGPAL